MTEPMHHIFPIEDPSALTREALNSAVTDLRERIDATVETRHREVGQTEQKLTTRLDGEVRVIAEKFAGIDLRFAERDVRTEQASSAAASALAAALQAAKELVGAQGEASAAAAVKSETSFTKQIDQIAALIQTGNAASDARVTELKERIDRGEGSSAGVKDARSDQRSGTNMWVGILGGIVAFMGLIIAAVALLAR